MDNVSPQGFQQGNFRPSESLATAPPPPSEVKIRTMRTDLESMAKSGGGLPRFQNIKVGGSGSAAERVVAPAFVAPVSVVATVAPTAVDAATANQPAPPQSQQTQSQPQPQMGGKSKTNVFGIVATIIILLALAIGGWFAYVNFFSNKATPSGATSPTTPTTQTNPATPSSTATAPAPSNSASVPVLVLPSTASSTASTTATSSAGTTH